jgi:hypothetical protein
MAVLGSIVSEAHTQSHVTLAWDRNAETNVAGYRLYWGIASRSYTNNLNVGDASTASVSNLAAGVTYRFAVTAYNAAGLESDFSSEISHTVTNSLASNAPPTLGVIPALTTNEDSGPRSVALTGITSGSDTENQTLAVSVASTPEWLLSTPLVTYTSPSSTGSISFDTATNAWGTGTITVTVSDGIAQVARSFSVTVNPVNDAPGLTSLGSRRINEDTSTGPIAFTIGDVETPSADLTLSATSSNPSLVPNANIVFGGSASNRTVQVTPAADQFGAAAITVWVSDGSLAASRPLQLTVTNVNDAPTMTSLPAAVVRSKTTTSLSPMLIADIDTPATNLTVRASSSNPNVLPLANIFLGSNDLSRSLSVHPLKAGSTTITLTVSDSLAEGAQSFSLTVTNAPRVKVRPSTISNLAEGFTIAWESAPGEVYRVLANRDLTQTNWVDVSGELAAVTTTTSWTDQNARSHAACLYMIESVEPALPGQPESGP